MFLIKMKLLIINCIFLLFLSKSYQLESSDIVFIILSQSNLYHEQLAKDLKANIIEQSESLQTSSPIIYLSHLKFSGIGEWTIFPIIPKLLQLHENNTKWIIFCQDVTRFKLKNLLNLLTNYDSNEKLWFGHALFDQEATIIHHFAFHKEPKKFLYPNIASGFVISVPLLKSVNERLSSLYKKEIDFSIDASHELALFVWDNDKGVSFKNESLFCIQDKPPCASFVLPFKACEKLVQKDQIIYAVKTCKKFHKDRIPILQKTWAQYVPNIFYYSEEYDPSIPTVKLDVPNTENGHCGKTMGILNNLSEKLKKNANILWVVIMDDDTILSSSRLEKLLSCYNSEDYVIIGERYGFRVYEGYGYNYVTGGGGMVFSAPLVHYLTSPGVCKCPSNDTPDDMYLGFCLFKLGINITHSMAFHQARPPDYAMDYLKNQEPISFHKHWMIDPVKVYNDWFYKEDLVKNSHRENIFHADEL